MNIKLIGTIPCFQRLVWGDLRQMNQTLWIAIDKRNLEMVLEKLWIEKQLLIWIIKILARMTQRHLEHIFSKLSFQKNLKIKNTLKAHKNNSLILITSLQCFNNTQKEKILLLNETNPLQRNLMKRVQLEPQRYKTDSWWTNHTQSMKKEKIKRKEGHRILGQHHIIIYKEKQHILHQSKRILKLKKKVARIIML